MIHLPLAVGILAVMVLFLVLISLYQLRQFRIMALRISYLEGTTDMIFRSQEHINKLLVAFMENN